MLITPEYVALNIRLHREVETYGTSSWKEVPAVVNLCGRFATNDVLDYGCGKGRLAEGLDFPIQSYDPALPEFAMRPSPAELVVCTDVMEHVEPECLDEVLEDVRELTIMAAYFVIATRPAVKVLGDGRNTHLIVESMVWWSHQLAGHGFFIGTRDAGTGRKGEAVFTAVV